MERGRRFTVNWRNGFIPISLIVVFVLKWRFGLPFWGLCLLLIPLGAYYLLLPLWVKQKLRAFERQFFIAIQQQKGRNLLEIYKKQWLLRSFGPEFVMKEKLAFIYSQLGNYKEACLLYKQALEKAPLGKRSSILLGLANNQYILGQDTEAEKNYRTLLKQGLSFPAIYYNLADIILRRYKDSKEAIKFLKQGLPQVRGKEKIKFRLALAEAYMMNKDLESCQEYLEFGDNLLENQGSLRAKYHFIKGRLFLANKNPEEAKKEFAKVIELDLKGDLTKEVKKIKLE
jgi:tetratricopeptide (TPR) repeat protein